MNYADREWEIETRKERNQPLPDWYINKVELPPYLQWFVYAFWELNTCRCWNEGTPLPISWLSVRFYAEYNDFDLDYLFPIIRAMDDVFIEFNRKEYNKRIRESNKQVASPNK